MKKLVSVLLVLVLLCCTTALSESLDPKQLSLDELIEMRKQITAEINERLAGTDGVFFPSNYTVGKHIPAGCYLITGVEGIGETNFANIIVWAANKTRYDAHIRTSVKPGEVTFVDLVEGDTVCIEYSTVSITPYVLPSF